MIITFHLSSSVLNPVLSGYLYNTSRVEAVALGVVLEIFGEVNRELAIYEKFKPSDIQKQSVQTII